jgi:HPt (histidine-containing phosphotransfer) domain-containing protein
VDARVLEELDQLVPGGNLVDELAETFLADAAVQLALLDEALVAGDGATVGHVAHRLKGSSANLGATELARLCSLLPTSDEPPEVRTSAAVLSAIHLELERVREFFIELAALR